MADAALSRQRDPARDSQFRTDNMIAATEPGIPGGDEIERPTAPFAKARTVREHFRALRERLEYEHLVGKLLVVQEVEYAGHEVGMMVREAFEVSAERIAEAIAAQLQVDRPASDGDRCSGDPHYSQGIAATLVRRQVAGWKGSIGRLIMRSLDRTLKKTLSDC